MHTVDDLYWAPNGTAVFCPHDLRVASTDFTVFLEGETRAELGKFALVSICRETSSEDGGRTRKVAGNKTFIPLK